MTTRTGQSLHFSWAVLGIGLTSLLVGCTALISPDFQSLLRGRPSEALATQTLNPSLDPQVGATVAPIVSASFSREGQTGTRSRLIIFLGSCSECTLKALQATLQSIPANRYTTVVAHTRPLEPEVIADLTRMGVNAATLDSDGALHRKFNIAFNPRVFLISAADRILWKQDEPSIAALAGLGAIN
jgi:hypothetical protein